jgi:hypothetical protein
MIYNIMPSKRISITLTEDIYNKLKEMEIYNISAYIEGLVYKEISEKCRFFVCIFCQTEWRSYKKPKVCIRCKATDGVKLRS